MHLPKSSAYLHCFNLICFVSTGSFLRKSAKLFFRRRRQHKEPGMSQSHNDLVYLESPTAVERANRTATLGRVLTRKSKNKSKANGSTLVGLPWRFRLYLPQQQELALNPPPQACTRKLTRQDVLSLVAGRRFHRRWVRVKTAVDQRRFTGLYSACVFLVDWMQYF